MKTLKDLGDKFIISVLVFTLGLILTAAAVSIMNFDSTEASELTKEERAAQIQAEIIPLKVKYDSNIVAIENIKAENNTLIDSINAKNETYHSILGL